MDLEHLYDGGGAMPRSKTPPAGQPIVSTVGRAAELLELDTGRLASAVEAAQLPPWGRHASGEPVYRWGRLCALAVELGSILPARYTHAWRIWKQNQTKADRGRANRKSKKVPT
jgi:hypothetical protein